MNVICGEYSALVRQAKAERSAYIAELIRAAFTRLTARIRNWIEYKQAEAQLSGMSERELQDMGLRRGDITAAVRGSLSNDNHVQHAA